jgi:hypothetical protein
MAANTKVTPAGISGSGVVTWQSVQTTNFTASAGKAYPVNTTSAGITVTLPSTAVVGDQISVVDYAGTAATNNITINPNGLNLNGASSNYVMNTKREAVTLTYIDSTQGWLLTSDAQITLPLAPYTISYLVVAGGGNGGGAANGGGGGAGGLLASTASLTPGIVYTITVGAGGGNNSSISGSIATAIGGGTGGTAGSPPGNSGGSGGGGNQGASGGSGTSGQGNAGGSGNSVGPGFPGGGGGGAGAVGQNASGGSTAGNGGIGLTTSLITTTQATTYSVGQVSGGSVYFAGGGGGNVNPGTQGTGGLGGGGVGIAYPSSGGAGTANTGGGGGSANSGNPGGSGVVILSVPTSYYSGTTTGSPSVTTNGSNTVLIFKSTGSYTA